MAGWQGKEKKRRIRRETPPKRYFLREGGLHRFCRFNKGKVSTKRHEGTRRVFVFPCLLPTRRRRSALAHRLADYYLLLFRWRLVERNHDTMTPSHLDTSGWLAVGGKKKGSRDRPRLREARYGGRRQAGRGSFVKLQVKLWPQSPPGCPALKLYLKT